MRTETGLNESKIDLNDVNNFSKAKQTLDRSEIEPVRMSPASWDTHLSEIHACDIILNEKPFLVQFKAYSWCI